jgi:hypothetical protein
MAELTRNGVKVTIEIWNDNGKITFSHVDQDFGPKGLIGSFKPGSAAELRARELLIRHGKLPRTA